MINYLKIVILVGGGRGQRTRRHRIGKITKISKGEIHRGGSYKSGSKRYFKKAGMCEEILAESKL